jgi:ABC-type transporter Mla subunit MlaD
MKTLIAATLAVALVAFLNPAGAQGQDDRPNIAQLVEDVNAIADTLQTNISGVRDALAAAADSRENGAKLLEQMQASIEAVHGSLAEDSDIWTELTRVMDIWDENRQVALEKSETNPAFGEIAEEWSIKIQQAGDLRKQILDQRANSMAMLDQVMAERELVLAFYDLGQADRALEAMQTVSDDLGRMNDSMRAIVDQTQVVAGATVPQ